MRLKSFSYIRQYPLTLIIHTLYSIPYNLA